MLLVRQYIYICKEEEEQEGGGEGEKEEEERLKRHMTAVNTDSAFGGYEYMTVGRY